MFPEKQARICAPNAHILPSIAEQDRHSVRRQTHLQQQWLATVGVVS